MAAALFALLAPTMLVGQAAAETIFVSDEQANVLHVIDGASLAVTGAIPVGGRPRGLALSPDGRRLYIAEGLDGRIDVLDLATRRVVDHLPSGPDPERITVSADGTRIYVANEDDAAVSFVDVAAHRIVGTVAVGAEPEGIAVSPDGGLVVATSESASLAHFIDARSGRLLDSLIVGTRPRDAHFTPDGRQVWVSSEQRGTVSIFDPLTRGRLHTIDLETAKGAPDIVQAVQIVMTRDGSRAFVAMGRGDAVAEIDAHTFEVVRFDRAGERDWNLALSPDERRIYTANGISGDASVIDLASGATIATIKLGGRPWGAIAVP
ncbi:MAG TPA: PQQ-dependent catabolism-associated beta-propeller protein [Caulobacteraceae bacterium]|jgi:PQQ-dependent catabolism-associated beta-propeller protein|nr:PQQ-dependent catabolism-associated beta-propeller protein [Caulobacteraceae bacterium]